MSNYKEVQVSGTSYVRANQVILDNPKGGVPSVTFVEEKLIEFNGESTARPTGLLTAAFDPAGVINILDPVTGNPTGAQVTQGEMYAAIYSFYIQEAVKRDAEVARIAAAEKAAAEQAAAQQAAAEQAAASPATPA